MSARAKSKDIIRSLQLTLAGTVLASGLSHAVLRDHGPGDPTVIFPQWYRDYNDLALGICKYADNGANGPLCLTTPADTNPSGFAGNLGDEAFYSAFGAILIINGGSFNYTAALEMAYGNATGTPPAVRDPANPAEIVFSRVRMRMDVAEGCGGHYTIRHPFGTNEFDLEPGTRSLNYTDDVAPVNGDFSAAHRGHQGPFLTWDSDLPILVPQAIGAPHEYVADPNVLHTYTGSAVPNTGDGLARHPEHVFQNFIEIVPPPTCDLGAGPGEPAFDDTASLSGLKWTDPIPTPTRIDKASISNSPVSGKNAMDVWVSSSSKQNLVLTVANDQSPAVPGIKLKENDTPSGTYFAHLEFDGDAPPLVTVTNLSSVPASQDTAAVVDGVDITKADYDSLSHVLCVAAHSEAGAAAGASLEAPPYGAFKAPTATCPAVDSKDLVLEKDLDDFAPEKISPPTSVYVHSSLGGSDSKAVISSVAVSDAVVTQMAVDDNFSVQGTGQTPLNVGQNDLGAPANYRIVVVSQPETLKDGKLVSSGAVTAPSSGGTITYAAAEGLSTHDTFFFYAVQDIATDQISNVAKVSLHVEFSAAPPVGVADSFAMLRTRLNSSTARSFTASVLANDTTGLAGFPIVPGTIQIASQGNRGAAVANSNGTITYQACTPTAPGSGICALPIVAPAAGQDSFTYTVANSAGARSTPITVTVVLQSTAETLTVQRVRYNAPKWDIRMSTNWFGAPLAPTLSCYLIANNGVAITPALIGTVPADATGNFQLQATAGGTVPSASGTWQVRCTSSNGATTSSFAFR